MAKTETKRPPGRPALGSGGSFPISFRLPESIRGDLGEVLEAADEEKASAWFRRVALEAIGREKRRLDKAG